MHLSCVYLVVALPLGIKVCGLPLHYTLTKIKQDVVSKPGLEPTTHPQAGWPAKSGCRKMVCCNHPITGGTPCLIRTDNQLLLRESALPISVTGHMNLVESSGVEPLPSLSYKLLSPICDSNFPCMVPSGGFEPPTNSF